MDASRGKVEGEWVVVELTLKETTLQMHYRRL